VHLICDNLATHKTPAIRDWLARHPRFHLHFTPTGSSWINQVVRHEVARVQRYSSKEGRLMSMV
jgi:transposase